MDRSLVTPRFILPSLFVLALFLVALGCSGGSRDRELVVFAAASLTDVVREVGDAFLSHEPQAHRDGDLVFNFAGSNVLAQQIRATPAADVFLSADVFWVDELERAGCIDPASRIDFLSNRLVLIANRRWARPLARIEELPEADFDHLALADPEAVPAGRYARRALVSAQSDGASVWEGVKDRVAPTLDVRAALALVESDPRVLGIVYRTDAATSGRVKTLLEIPPSLHPPITYCGAAVVGRPDPERGRRFLEFLGSPAARSIYSHHGFVQNAP